MSVKYISQHAGSFEKLGNMTQTSCPSYSWEIFSYCVRAIFDRCSLPWATRFWIEGMALGKTVSRSVKRLLNRVKFEKISTCLVSNNFINLNKVRWNSFPLISFASVARWRFVITSCNGRFEKLKLFVFAVCHSKNEASFLKLVYLAYGQKCPPPLTSRNGLALSLPSPSLTPI